MYITYIVLIYTHVHIHIPVPCTCIEYGVSLEKKTKNKNKHFQEGGTDGWEYKGRKTSHFTPCEPCIYTVYSKNSNKPNLELKTTCT